ncbi:GNAT family N-acetyltransferase [Chitinophaga ginsengisegetis]|uniref:GNAT family N-acetyltransferase n=1 Tax=Chitinophaga ginsengisegetis TaxID=393003 RepID=UPI000DB8FA52|nr:GNAT family N-acetyltransferase [Chitinophaga ginsengisegetis]MDR6567679.1 GNAT superfamily N-acetyltransferase [Chitinophaga ginsengisegetis]MDR6647766.1 GNAT superfamily N-acetyltransferase [Chitinophaga ginsengisegetis]MDR6654116.1 GNAT superfamily N-acetyltransferase [Chitinophaga ginsengisegetis]
MPEVIIKTGKENMDVKMIHRFLQEDSYWAKGISYSLVDHSLTHSFCTGAFVNGEQVGFGRVITDYYTFGWFADFFVLPAYRGKGISKKMLAYILDQPWSKRLRRKILNTSDAHGLYRQFQFKDLANASGLLEIYHPTVHLEYKEEADFSR